MTLPELSQASFYQSIRFWLTALPGCRVRVVDQEKTLWLVCPSVGQELQAFLLFLDFCKSRGFVCEFVHEEIIIFLAQTQKPELFTSVQESSYFLEKLAQLKDRFLKFRREKNTKNN